jgi:hypothetical protein
LVVPVDDPVALPAAVDPPAVEPPPAEPAPPCAKASVPVSASAVANPIVASRMMIFLVFSDKRATAARQEAFLR